MKGYVSLGAKSIIISAIATTLAQYFSGTIGFVCRRWTMVGTFWVTTNSITTFTTKVLIAVSTVHGSIVDATNVTVLPPK